MADNYRDTFTNFVMEMRNIKKTDDFNPLEYATLLKDVSEYIAVEKTNLNSKIAKAGIKLDE